MENRMMKCVGLAVVLGMILTLGGAPLASALEVRPGRSGELDVAFEPVKPVYSVGERIRFRVKGNQTFYLYLFSIDDQTNRGVVILPNRLQQYNKYRPGELYIVPEKDVEFYGDRPGRERIIMVASTEKLDVDWRQYSVSGDFWTGSAKEMDETVKTLRFRRRGDDDAGPDRVAHEVDLVIMGEAGARRRPDPTPPPSLDPAPDAAMAFVSTDRTEYRRGDTIAILFGADQEGTVTLYLEEPDGNRRELARQEVTGRDFYRLRARATAPSGRHRITAVYSDAEAAGAGSKDGLQSKGLELIGGSARPHAVYYFDIQ